MSAWALNRLLVTGPPAEVVRFARRMPGRPATRLGPAGRTSVERPRHGDDDCGPQRFCLNAFHPVPDAVLRSPDPAAIARWQEVHWGCDYDADPQVVIRRARGVREIDFETPWAAPVVWLGHVAAEYPALYFGLDWLLPYDISEHGSATAEGGVLDVGPVEEEDDVEWLEHHVFGARPWGGGWGAGTGASHQQCRDEGGPCRRRRPSRAHPGQLTLFDPEAFGASAPAGI